jgi:hypothetical protein
MKWFAAMGGILPFVLVGRPKARTWAALFGAACAAWIVPAMAMGDAVDSAAIGRYIVIDAIAGSIVLARPAGWVQKFIGAVFALMVSFHVGFLIADKPVATLDYLHWLSLAGWLQWAALAVWGLYDTGKAIAYRFGRGRNMGARHAGAG